MTAPAHGFHDQFILSRDEAAPVPENFVSRQIHDWILSSHPALPVFNVMTSGETIGWLIGHAVGADGALVRGDVTIENSTPDAFERWLYAHGGRFAGVLMTPNAKRVYLDPLGTRSLVFLKDRPLAGSTSSLLFYGDRDRFADAMYAEHGVAANQFFPAGLTSRPDVERLLPNHFLVLNEWRVARHWPTEPILRVADDASAAQIMRDVTDTIRRTIDGVAKRYPLYVTISAGRDSRMVMGCTRGAADRATFVTFAYPEKEKFADVHVATRLCKRVGVRHVVLPMAPTETPDKQRYLYRIGYDGNWGKARDFDGACARHLDMSHAWLTGFGAEIRRPFYWVPGEVAKTVFDAADLLKRMKLPADDASLRAVEQWLARTPLGDPITAFDLMYIEQKVGAWASPQMYGAAPFAVNLTPFSHRRVLEQMMRLPPSYRAQHKPADEMLRLTWPELLEFPYNDVTGVRLLVKRVREKVRHKLKRIRQRVRGELR